MADQIWRRPRCPTGCDVRGLDISYFFTLLASKCMQSEMSKFAKKRQESRLTFGTHSSDLSKGSTPLYQAVDAIALMLYSTLQKQDGQIEEKVWGK